MGIEVSFGAGVGWGQIVKSSVYQAMEFIAFTLQTVGPVEKWGFLKIKKHLRNVTQIAMDWREKEQCEKTQELLQWEQKGTYGFQRNLKAHISKIQQ